MRQYIETEEALIEQMTTPSEVVRQAVGLLEGDVLILGVGGKMGPSLAELLVKAGARRVIGVSRFSDKAQQQHLEKVGVQTLAADLLDQRALESLPEAACVFFLAGFKFGATDNEDSTWAMNAWLPGRVVQRYAGSRLVYVSSGNVYAYTPAKGPGAAEGGELGPIGEYAQSRLGGERLAQYFSRVQGTRLVIVRLFYATELRYGIIHDLAWKVWQGEPIDLTMGRVNQIWQGEANAYLCRFFPLCSSPATAINLTGPEVLSVRWMAQRLGQEMGKEPLFRGQEAPDALLGDASRLCREFGRPQIGPELMIRWVAHWVMQGGKSLGKPTKYESRSGRF